MDKNHELDLDRNIFIWKDPRRIAISLKKSAEESILRKTTPYASAKSMLNSYIKQGGKRIDHKQRIILQQTKEELRHIFHKD